MHRIFWCKQGTHRVVPSLKRVSISWSVSRLEEHVCRISPWSQTLDKRLKKFTTRASVHIVANQTPIRTCKDLFFRSFWSIHIEDFSFFTRLSIFSLLYNRLCLYHPIFFADHPVEKFESTCMVTVTVIPSPYLNHHFTAICRLQYGVQPYHLF